MKGTYVLLMKLSEDRKIKIGKLGKINFKKGFYAYVGSAMSNLEKRVARHLQRKKKLHWHIDYFLQNVKIRKVFYKQANKKHECKIAKNFARKFQSIKKFGCSDCKCESHLFYSENFGELKDNICKINFSKF